MSDEKRDEGFAWPEGEGPPDGDELRAAREHAARVERMLEGGAADGDELATLAGMIHRTAREGELGAARRARLLDEVLKPQVQAAPRRRQLASVFAMAAAMLLALGIGLGIYLQEGERAPARRMARAPRALSPQMLSRSSDGLLGKPIVDRAGASRRLDRVFASRLAGYRALRMNHWRAP